jgi:hypothetical protein
MSSHHLRDEVMYSKDNCKGPSVFPDKNAKTSFPEGRFYQRRTPVGGVVFNRIRKTSYNTSKT